MASEDNLEDKIYRCVAKSDLIRFGRFHTVKGVACLSWIFTTPLLDERDIYQLVLQCFRERISQNTNEKSKIILVGIDHWGSILAARLGAALNIRSCSIALRGGPGLYDDRETLNDKLKRILEGKTDIYFLTDVISTGDSIVRLIRDFSLDDVSYYALSVICDPNQERSTELSKLEFIGYACGSIKTPLIDASLLPDEQVFIPDISYVANSD